MSNIVKIEAKESKKIQRRKVAAYTRVSEDSEQLLHSLSAQISYYSNLIQSNPEWEYAGVYADEGITGTSIAKRKEFQRLVADCKDKKIDLVLAKSISRFARNTVDLLNTVRYLKEIGVEVRFERENISTFTSDGELLLTLLASFAQAESESISDNVKWATRKRFQEGIPNGHKATYGYVWDGDIFRIIPEQGRIVREIYDRYLAGETAYAIAKALEKRGVAGPGGGKMYDSAVKDILSNISYTGTMLLQKNFFNESHIRKRNRGELPMYAVEGMFEPLVTNEEYEKAQQIRKQRADAAANKDAVRTVFSGLVKCGTCGSSVSRRSAGKRKQWTCNKRERKGITACDMRPIQEEELEEAAKQIRGEFKRITIYGDRIEFLLANGSEKSIQRHYGRYRCGDGFSGKLVCGVCGRKCTRVSWKKGKANQTKRMVAWRCTTPCVQCDNKPFADDELRSATVAIIGKENYEGRFVEYMKKAIVHKDSVEFHFKDGTVKTWLRE